MKQLRIRSRLTRTAMLLALLLTATTAWAFEATIELESGPYVYKGNDTPVKPRVIRVVFDGVEVELDLCTITYGKNNYAGKDAGWVNVEYNGGVAEMKFDIQRAPLTVTAASATKVYDGTPLTDSGFTLVGLMPDDANVEYYPTVTVTGSQTEVGSSYNVPSNFHWEGTDYSGNYDVTYVNGTLTVTWQGAGTLANPYIINNTGGLDMLATNVNAGNDYEDTYFQLGDDITYTHGSSTTENNYTAIGCRVDYDTYHTFKGHFDGNGKTISGIRIYKGGNNNGDCYQGLFGIIRGSTAEVKNITLADARITGMGSIGGIVGNNQRADGEEHGGTVSNCHVLNNVTIHAVLGYTDCHGGIVGGNQGSVSGCTSAASITTASGLKGCTIFGGIVGSNSDTVTDCLYLGTTLNGNLRVGAIAGMNSRSVKNCYYTSTTITGKDVSGNEIANASCVVGDNHATVTNCGQAQHTITLGSGVALANATEYNVSGLTGYGDFALSYNDGTTTYIYALEGATVTVNYNGGAIPANTFWKVTYIDGDYNEHDVTVTDNQDGTYGFTMPAYNVTAAVYKDFTKCTAYVPDPIYHAYYDHCYFYDGTWNDNHGGIKVWDPEGNELTYGTDYRFSMLIDDDQTDWQKVGDHCRVILEGCGEWAGQLTADVVIIAPGEDNGTWGNLSWNYDGNGKLTITGTGAMNKADSYDAYPWYKYHSVITSVVIGEGITSVAASAFGGNQNAIVYGDLATVSLPTALESIGDNAFAYCTALTVDLDDILENTKVTLANISSVTPFNQVGKIIGTLYDGSNNAQVFEIMAFAQKAKVTIKGRKLWRDGDWNTLCLPFKVEKTGIFADATIMQLDVTGIYDNKQTGLDGTTLNLYFKDATSIEAGMPYLIKWETTGDPITDDLVFNDVKVYAPMHDVTSQDNKVTFKGIYSPISWEEENESILFLGAANKLYWPKPADASTPVTLNAFRAYFELSADATATAISLNFDGEGETTSLTEMRNERNGSAWYTLQGRKLMQQPTQKGLYIVNGRKVVVK